MKNLEDIVVKNYEWVDELNNLKCLNFNVSPTDELIQTGDIIRKGKGFTDLASDSENDVYYNFYLNVYFNNKNDNVTLYFTCNNGEKDDWFIYELKIDEREKNTLLFKAFKCYIEESEV